MAVNLDQESVKMNVREVVVTAIISTLFIGVPCSQATRLIPDDLTIGEWDTEHRIYVLKQDVSEPLEVVQGGLVVDGSGHKVTGGGSGVGIKIVGKGRVTVKNIAVEGWDVGIHIENSTGVRVVENVCTNNFQGIRLNSSNDNQLIENTCSDSRRAMYGSGIILHDSHRNIVRGNEARNNYSFGIFLEAGSGGNRLEGNTITDGTYQGISLSNAPENIIASNQSTGNTYGIVLVSSSTGNVLTQNTVSDNLLWGIGLVQSNNNEIYNNNLIANTGYQAYVDRSSGANIFSLPEYGGNYWSDHTEPNIDADPRFVDTPYLFPEDQRDDRPWAVKDGWREPPIIAQNMIDRVKELVAIGSLNEGQGNSLKEKLEGFLKQYKKGKTKTALNQLNAFVNHAQALIYGGVLSPEEGQPLVAGAGTILVKLGAGTAKLATVSADPPVLEAYPNPFNPTTTIHYVLPEISAVNLTIYDSVGQQVKILVDAFQGAGDYAIVWDGRDTSERMVAAGVYLYRLEAGKQVEVRKMVFAK